MRSSLAASDMHAVIPSWQRRLVVIALLAVATGCTGNERSSSRAASRDTTASAASTRGDTATPGGAGRMDTTPSTLTGAAESRSIAEHVVTAKTLGPFTVEGATYVVEMDRYKGEGDTGVSHLVVKNAAGAVMYEEDLSPLRDPEPESSVDATAYVLEDAQRRPRGLILSYDALPSAPGVPATTRLLGLRDGRLRVLSTWPDTDALPEGTQPGSKQLLPGNLLPEVHRLDGFSATIMFLVDMSCAPGGDTCVTLAPVDSIGHLRRLVVHETPTAIDEQVDMPLYARPDSATTPTRITLNAGTTVKILGGAARVRIETSDPDNAGGPTLKISDPWLYIRVNDVSGWVHGEETLHKIGIVQAG